MKEEGMTKERVSTPKGPAAIGPYSQAIVAGNLVFVSGQIPLDPDRGNILVEGDITVQTERVLKNLAAILEAAGSSLDRVVKTTVYLADMDDFPAVNAIYESYFKGDSPPARATVEVARLPKSVGVEIDAIGLR